MLFTNGRSYLALLVAAPLFAANVSAPAMSFAADEAVVRHENKDEQKIPGNDGWVSLFNGENLEGWSQKNGWATYRVKDGKIVGKTSEGSPNSFLCTEKVYGDFELRFEVKVDNALNSGVQIRSRSLPEHNNGRVHGPQVEIEASPGEAGYIYGEATTNNWVSPTQPPHSAIKNDEWNQYHIRAVGKRIQTWINGKLVEDLTDPKCFSEGFIGLQVHGIGANDGPFKVRWKNIEIKELNK